MKSFSTALSLFLALSCLTLTVSCAAQPASRPWTVSDLRLLDPPDDFPPALDILAVYTHTSRLSVDLRVDLLDIHPGDAYRLEISLWDDRYFRQVPLVMDIPSVGTAHTTSAAPGAPFILPRLVQNPWLDTVTVSLNRAFIGDHFRFDVVSYAANSSAPADQALGLRSDDLPPTRRAPLLLAFWNVFPAATPIQALRRWDGAHTGPLGERHGLRYLLEAAGRYRLPMALLDLKTPASLAALNDMGSLPWIGKLDNDGLLILPDAAYAEPSNVSLSFSRRAATAFGLPGSQFVYAASSGAVPGALAQFITLADASHLAASGGTRLIPLPGADAVEATPDGPSLEVRRALFEAAFAADPSTLVALGGSLPDSTWGNAVSAGSTCEWLAAHPWVQILSGNDLLAFPLAGRGSISLQTDAEPDAWLEPLQAAPANSITDSAWQTYLTLTSPTADEKLRALRAAYLGQVGELLAAARWAENPSAQAGCSADLDGDGQPECILANRQFFAILDPAGARLTNLFYLDGSGPHQLVAPSSQFTVGLSDPSEWKPELGKAADPSVIPGAFNDETDPWAAYKAQVSAQEITFTRADDSRAKTFVLTENGLELRYQGMRAVSTRLPLAVDPQAFFFGPADYLSESTSDSWRWSLDNGIRVEVRSNASLAAESFTSALPFLSASENPDLQYPRGAYLPFPLSVVTLRGEGDIWVLISIK